jgi:hypothetical protein
MTVGRKIADNQRNSYLAGLIVGLILYLVLLSFNDWNPVAVVTNVVFLEFSVVTGLVMRFLSGLGLALTYATFGVLFFRLVSPTLSWCPFLQAGFPDFEKEQIKTKCSKTRCSHSCFDLCLLRYIQNMGSSLSIPTANIF